MLSWKVSGGLLIALLLAIGWGGWEAWSASDLRKERDMLAEEVRAATAALAEMDQARRRSERALTAQQARADANARELANVRRSYAALGSGRGCVDTPALRAFLERMQQPAGGAAGDPNQPAGRPDPLPGRTAGPRATRERRRVPRLGHGRSGRREGLPEPPAHR